MISRERRKQMEGKVGLLAFDIALRTLGHKTPEAADRIGERLGRFLMRVSKKHRNRALSNLELAMPELDPEERLAIARRCFEHFGRISADFMRTPYRTAEELRAATVYSELDRLRAILAEGKGVLAITGHFGNWERSAHYVAVEGVQLHVVARDANQQGVNARMLEIRRAAGVEVLSRGSAAREILRLLRQKEAIAILPDQNSEEIYVPFFGKPCGTVQGPATLSERTHAPVVPVFYPRVGPNKYHLIVMSPLEPEPGYPRVEGLTREVNLSLEKIIREYPEQWLWFHDRWKSARRNGLL